MNIANNILRIMRQKGISRRELIERLKGKVDRTHVYRILRGETAMPTIDKVKEIANALAARFDVRQLHDYWFRGGYPEVWLKNNQRFSNVWMQNYLQPIELS